MWVVALCPVMGYILFFLVFGEETEHIEWLMPVQFFHLVYTIFIALLT